MELNKLGIIGNSYYVSLPKKYIDALHWQLGNYIIIRIDQQSLILTKISYPKQEEEPV